MNSRLSHVAGAGLLAVGGATFLLVFWAHLHAVSPDRYADRDDAVITLSHARNLIEYGFIGTSPSGERVEGFSAPLQFFVATAAYAIKPFTYTTFFYWQTRIGTVLLGAAFVLLFWTVPRDESPSMLRMTFIVVATAASAQILASSTAFLWWHASGMENAYKSVGLVTLIWALDRMLCSGRISWLALAVVALAAITRIDAIVPVALLVCAFAVLWFAAFRNAGGLAFGVVSALPWIAFMAWRWWYFGQWEPTTGLGQSIDVGSRVRLAVLFPAQAIRQYWAWFGYVGDRLFVFQLLWMIPLVLYFRRNRIAVHRAILLAVGTFACILQFALFGPSRMDVARTVTELALYSTAAAPLLLLAADNFKGVHMIAGCGIMALSVAATAGAAPHASEIGWGAARFEPIADQFDGYAAREDLPRPMIANPDLGAISWRKHFNVVDLGRLGSTFVSRVPSPGAFVGFVVQPDLIELHAPWSCGYPDLFAPKEFSARYLRLTTVDPREATCPGPTGPTVPVFWIRRAIISGTPSNERLFLDRFKISLDPDLVRQELERCLVSAGPHPCGYVGRTVFRFVAELKARHTYSKVAAMLDGDPRLLTEHALFTSSIDPHWWRPLMSVAIE